MYLLKQEGLLLKLQDVTTHRHKLFTQKATIAPLVATTTESAFLLEMSSYTIKLTKLLLQAEGKRLEKTVIHSIFVHSFIHSFHPSILIISGTTLTHSIFNLFLLFDLFLLSNPFVY